MPPPTVQLKIAAPSPSTPTARRNVTEDVVSVIVFIRASCAGSPSLSSPSAHRPFYHLAESVTSTRSAPMTTEPAFEQLHRLVGNWTTEATHPASLGLVVHGTAEITWLEGE